MSIYFYAKVTLFHLLANPMSATAAEPAAAPPPQALLRVDALTLSFGGVQALRGVGFDVQPGSITAVIGPNGAGKTSLFNAISGFYRPTGGRVLFKGQDISRVPAPKRAALGLARSFQNIALFRGMTVLDNIKLGRHAHLKTNVLDALLYLGRARREEAELRRDVENASSTSWRSTTSATRQCPPCPTACKAGGGGARAGHATAGADAGRAGGRHEPRRDRGHGALHPGRAARMGRDGADGGARHGMVMDLSDHVVVLNFGQVIAQGTPAQVQANPEVVRAYLGAGGLQPAAPGFPGWRQHPGNGGGGLMDWGYLLEICLTGLAGGGLYALAGLAFVLVYKTTRVVNIAIGEMLMVGAYLFFVLASQFGAPSGPPCWAPCWHRAAGRGGGAADDSPADGPPAHFSFHGHGGAGGHPGGGWWRSSGPPTSAACPSSCPARRWSSADALLSPKVAYGSLLAAVIIALVLALFRFWRGGVALRATASDQGAAYMMGINVPRVFSLAWVAAGMIAAVSGIVVGAIAASRRPWGVFGLSVLVVVIVGGWTACWARWWPACWWAWWRHSPAPTWGPSTSC